MWTPSPQYAAGLFDGEGSISLAVHKDGDGHNQCKLHVRVSNSNRFALDGLRRRWGGIIATYQPAYHGSRLHHALAIEQKKATRFLEDILPWLVIKRSLAWITICFIKRRKYTLGKPLISEELDLRFAVRDLIMKINSNKGHRGARGQT